jgi:tRNA-binding EMAP/Myf-like protein
VSELVIGRIVAVAENPGARAPSFLVTVDLGPQGREELILSTGSYPPGELEGAQVLCRRDAGEVRLAGAHSHGKGLVLLRPDREVEDGTIVD